jgi:hypothetical protein
LTGTASKGSLPTSPTPTSAISKRYTAVGRAEKRICDAKDTGLANLPSANFAINSAWLQLVLVAQDLIAWTKLLCLDGELAHAEPKRLRYCLFHAAGIITRSGRQTRLRIAAGWPWVDQLVNAFTYAYALALPA